MWRTACTCLLLSACGRGGFDSAAPTPPGDDSPSGFVSDLPPTFVVHTYDAHGYAFVLEELTWAEARSQCITAGGDLVIIEDQAEDEWLIATALAVDATVEKWFIGLSDTVLEGAFSWVNGTTPVYENWTGGEPNDFGGGEDCAELTTNKAWNDVPCDREYNYICEE